MKTQPRISIFTLLLCLAFVPGAYGQLDLRGFGLSAEYTRYTVDTNKIDTSSVYLYTKHGNATAKKEYADYYRRYKLIVDSPLTFRIKEYWMDGTIKKSYSSIAASFINRIGEYKEYNRKGILVFETYFSKEYNENGINLEIGPRIYYYDNGKPRIERKILNHHLLTQAAWDTTGKQTAVNGNGFASYDIERYDGSHYAYSGHIKDSYGDGTWTGQNPDGKIYCLDEYKDWEFKKGRSFDNTGNQYTYRVLYENNTADVTSRKLAADLIYYLPYKAELIGTYWRNDDVPVFFLKEAYVCHLEVDFDSSGVVQDVRILKGVNTKADDEIVYTIKFIKKVKPFILRGQPIGGTCVISMALPH